ncbi:hypothetical protein QQX98_010839 [Neonectria punicea]|uniref:Uncharacterized protein n=1 Tax=Neonectria punicea TaxID=979145 RepID=A0ABR1GNL9_9HYPO
MDTISALNAANTENILRTPTMPTITEERRQQIAEIESKIESQVEWIQGKQQELEDILELIRNVSGSALDQMSHSASSSTRKRGKGDTSDMNETIETYKQVVEDLQEAIEAREREIDELRAEKQVLES